MLAAKLATLGFSSTAAKAIVVIVLGAIAAGLTAEVENGFLTGQWAVLAPIVSGAITAIAALVDPNAGHS